MDREKIESLFTLFSGELDTTKYSPLIDSALYYIEKQIKDESYLTDTRLPFYAAAIANLSYMRILSLKVSKAQTYAGAIAEIPTEKNNMQIKFAEGLYESYRVLCSDLLIDSTFYFILSGENEE